MSFLAKNSFLVIFFTSIVLIVSPEGGIRIVSIALCFFKVARVAVLMVCYGHNRDVSSELSCSVLKSFEKI